MGKKKGKGKAQEGSGEPSQPAPGASAPSTSQPPPQQQQQRQRGGPQGEGPGPRQQHPQQRPQQQRQQQQPQPHPQQQWQQQPQPHPQQQWQQQQPQPHPQQRQQQQPQQQWQQQQPQPHPQQWHQQPQPHPQQQWQQQQPQPHPQQRQQQQPQQQWQQQQPQQQRGPRQQQGRPRQQFPPGIQQQRSPSPQQQYGAPPPHWGPPGIVPQQPMGQQVQGPPPQQPPRGPPPGMGAPQQQQPQRGPLPQQQQQQQQRRPQQQQPPVKSPVPHPEPSSPPRQEPAPPLSGGGDCLSGALVVTPGTKGRRIQIESNHLSLNLGKLTEAYHYDVAITPDTPKCLLRDVMNLFGRKHYPQNHPAFDGRKNLYSPKKLPFPNDTKSDTIEVEGENRKKEFKVEVKLARTVDLTPLHDIMRTTQSPQDALQCLDIVLRNAPSNACIIAGRCFFTPPRDGQIIPLGDGMELYYGFYQSAIRGWKALLNVDVAHKAFPKASNVLDIVCEIGSDFRTTMTRANLSQPLREFVQRDFEKFIKQLKVKYEIPNQSSSKRIHRVNGLGEPPSQAKFKLDDGRMTTVERYYQEVKRCKLQYPHLPTLWVGSRERESKILLPLEFCTVVGGQAINRKMNENQTSAMIRKAATSTDVRKDKIMQTLRTANYNNDPCIREFGFSVSNNFEKLDARVLNPPSLLYADNAQIKPSKGVWRADRNRFLVGATINKWTIASGTRYPSRDADKLADMIFRMASSNGMQITSKATPSTHIGGRQGLRDFIDYFKGKQDYDLIIVVVPNSGPQYSFVKQAAELNVGCLTQCIKERTIGRLNPQTVGNILLKINSKMNGTNHRLSPNSRPLIMKRPCMIMGADVTHPSPDARDIPSVAAVTASHDPNAFQYNICWRLQPPKVEIIEDLCNITVEQLKFFYQKTGFKPESIVFFRDGVSEGQFKQVQRAEIAAIQKACKMLQKDDYEPKITFLVVQKRHHTRLFPTNPRDSEDKNNNVPAGTCVDTHITNPRMQDFYLVSHASIQGVAKPTKYCTLWDDNNMNNDDIEELTYHLCHMFTRCNRSVSYPAPTYYAHLAAARAKVYIENDKLDMSQLKRHQEKCQIQEKIVKGKPMFFV
ncbi:argonaute-2b isoform X2 [Tribolium castaneum]|uniref:argonaute-2b isoform X2 n=1 Tax=Tribolium castaneum TaxID=7070 RepID=UPI0030FF2352